MVSTLFRTTDSVMSQMNIQCEPMSTVSVTFREIYALEYLVRKATPLEETSKCS